ncbi:MAG TPA: ribonuclease Y [Fimbriimonadaceae bacterium]|nr:ribonuclease Y [Fimbriimonadaceae bacterium]
MPGGNIVILIEIATLLVMALVLFSLIRRQKQTIQSTRDEAAQLAETLRVEAEQERKELLFQAREEALRVKQVLDEEQRERRAALDRLEEKLVAKDETIETRRERLESREHELTERARQLDTKEQELADQHQQVEQELQRMAGLTPDQARAMYLACLEDDFRELGTRRAREIEAETVAVAEKRARQAILDVMERCSVEYVTEATVAVVMLPTEEMKGRIIGREGRNIRAFEQVTGVDLIIDDTPEAVVISSFDPIRRETARLALMNLMVDGRIHPGRIEELYEKAQAEVKRLVLEAGERAAVRANIAGLPRSVIETMGKLRFRTSYAQNVLDHSVEVAHLAAMIAAEMGLNQDVARVAGFLHDIGKALGEEWEGPHAVTGMNYLRQCGMKDAVLHAVGAHHRDIEPTTPEAVAVIIADSLSAARPGARRENLENYVKRLSALEELATQFEGVERAYALQAGREIRLIVKPEEIDDLAAKRLAGEVARRIESEMEYPGQIKVTVIRETRTSEIAR